MNKKLNITQMVPRLHKVRAKDGFVTLLGIGPMSPMLLQGTLELAKEQDFPIMFIASRNQVDAECFGRGYVSNWDQNDFCSAIDAMAKRLTSMACTMFAVTMVAPGSVMRNVRPSCPKMRRWHWA